MKRLADTSDTMYLANRIMVGGPCWEWVGFINSAGYGRAFINGGQQAHRAVYEWMVGPIPEGLNLDHLCRNRSCVRPSHLEPVTQKENNLRGIGLSAENARKIFCRKGHPFDSSNTMLRSAYDGSLTARRCRTCEIEWRRRYNQLRAEKQEVQ